VESNDKLYGGSPSYMAELSELIYVSMSSTLQQLTSVGDVVDASVADSISGSIAQAKGALDLVNHLVYMMEVTPAVGLFINRLMELARKHKALFTTTDTKYYHSTIENVIVILQKHHRQQSSKISGSGSSSVQFTEDIITSLKLLN